MIFNLTQVLLKQRVFLALCFLLFFSGCAKKGPQWELERIQGDCPPQVYSKVFLIPSSTFNGIQVELVGVGSDQHLYLSVLCLQISPSSSSDSIVNVTITIEDQVYTVSAELLEGGQRVLLPEEAKDLIVCSLLNDQEVTIAMGRYRQTLISDNFKESLQKKS